MNTPPSRLAAATPLLAAEDPTTIAHAASILRNGGVVALPTDTVYGLAASLQRPDAIRRLYGMKSRPASKAIPVLLSDLAALDRIAKQSPAMLTRLATLFWPGALTLIVEAREGLPAQVTTMDAEGRLTVAVRLPDHPLTRSIIDAAGGALAVTSANRSGETPATEVAEIRQLAIGEPDAIVDGGPVAGGIPSTIVSVVDSAFTILREGAIPASDILAALQDSEEDAELFHGGAV